MRGSPPPMGPHGLIQPIKSFIPPSFPRGVMPPNKAMHLTALRAAGNRHRVRRESPTFQGDGRGLQLLQL